MGEKMPDQLKEKVQRIVSERGLYSCMNDTKWNKLRDAMRHEIPFQPPYIVKFLFDETAFVETDFQNDVYHTMDWYDAYAMDGYFHAAVAIEWIKVRPRYLKSRGALLEPEVISAESEFVAILNQHHIPFEECNGVYCIYGYR